MLAAAAARLRDRHDLVWVDMGGGTGVSARQLQLAKGSDSLRFDQPVPELATNARSAMQLAIKHRTNAIVL
jgi:hypothetical protein